MIGPHSTPPIPIRSMRLGYAIGATFKSFLNLPGWTRNISRAIPWSPRLARKGADYTEEDKQQLREKQIELLGRVLPEYRKRAAARDKSKFPRRLFITRFFRCCATPISRACQTPGTPLPAPAFRHPEDAREQLSRARRYHERVFGKAARRAVAFRGLRIGSKRLPSPPIWDSSGLPRMKASWGGRWASGFGRDGAGVPDNADKLYSPLRVRVGGREMVGFFRDHYLSDLVGFVYSRMDTNAAADDLYHRIRAIGERVHIGRPLTVSVDPGRRKCVGIFPRQRPRIPAAVLQENRQRSGYSSADGERSGRGRRRNSRGTTEFSRRPGSTPISTSGSARAKT